MLTPGKTLDRYTVEGLAGEGATARVYRVRHTLLGSRHALKVLHCGSSARFEREARAQACLRHPNVVGVTDAFTVDGHPVLVLDWVDGATLRDRLSAGPLPEPDAEEIFRGILSGLSAIHAAGFVHRDLKPASVLLSGTVPRVADFGLVGLLEATDAVSTRPGLLLGTPAYMAPEQVLSARVDARADVWALGAILAEMLTGRRLRGERSVGEILSAPGEWDAVADVAPRWLSLLETCLHPDPQLRPASAYAVARLLDAALPPAPTPSPAPTQALDAATDPREELVTLVFTDVEDSTAHWERDPSWMRQALAVHDAAMRRTLSAAGGYEVKTEGDAFMLSFSDPSAALRWCLSAQDALAEASWPPGPGRLQVRMGAHTGLAERRLDPTSRRQDWFGSTVNRAARIAAAANAGQVLVSAETWTLATGASVPAGVEVRDLGAFHLKGLSTPSRLYEVFRGVPLGAAPRATPVAAGNLPSHLEAVLGREEDLARLDAAWAEGARVLSLVGPGGMGKTTLAVAWASTIAMTAGAWFVDAASATSLPSLVGAVARSLRLVLPGEEEGLVALPLALRARGPLLLVLDNLEQVIDDAARLVSACVREAPEALFLVTSREPLRVTGERLVPLSGLSETSAVALFEERAKAVDPGFDATLHAPAIATIVRRVEGLPLGIELAAARVRSLSPATIASHLSSSLSLLKGGRRDAPARHASIDATIAWSWELLSEAERQALERLSVFEGAFEAEDAAEILEVRDAGDVLDLLTGLLERSLLAIPRGADSQGGGGERYRLLVPVRSFSARRLEGRGAARDARHRHAALWARRGDDLERRARRGEEGTLPVRTLRRAIPELEAALAFASAHAQGLALSLLRALATVHYAAGGNLCRAFLDTVGWEAWTPAITAAQNPGVRQALRLERLVWHNLDAPEAAREVAAIHADGEVPQALESAFLYALGLACPETERETAVRYFEAAELGWQATGEGWRALRVAVRRWDILEGWGGEVAMETVDKMVVALRVTGDAWGVAIGQLHAGHRLLALGRPEEAYPRWIACIEIGRQIGLDYVADGATGNLGAFYLHRDDLDRAEAQFQAALERARGCGAGSMERQWRKMLGRIYLARADAPAARSQLALASGDLPGALRLLRHALSISPPAARQVDLHAFVAAVLARTGDPAGAAERLPQAEAWVDANDAELVAVCAAIVAGAVPENVRSPYARAVVNVFRLGAGALSAYAASGTSASGASGGDGARPPVMTAYRPGRSREGGGGAEPVRNGVRAVTRGVTFLR